MAIKNIPLRSRAVNRTEARHGEPEIETAVMTRLLNTGEQHIRNLAKDIVGTGERIDGR